MPLRLSPDLPMLVHQTDTAYGHYEVWDTLYAGRPARVLYSGHRQTAQSGMAVDADPNLLFDYNQRLFELITGLQPRRLLVIGGGAYTLPAALLAVMPELTVDVVEIDGQLLPLAARFFDLQPDARLRSITADGRQFLQRSRQRYDVIVVDAFQNADTPAGLLDTATAALLQRHVTPTGLTVYNAIAPYRGLKAGGLQRRIRTLLSAFPYVDIYPASYGQSLWLPQNLLLIGRLPDTPEVQTLLRYPKLKTATAKPD